MRLVDANVLLYAVNEDAAHHDASRRWLDAGLSGDDTVGIAWIAALAFVRLVTKPGLFPRPMPVSDALGQVEEWMAAPGALVVHPGPAHAHHLRSLLTVVGIGGNLVNDAHLAALAVEHRAEVVSYDNDFSRFPEVRWRTPEQLLA